MDQRKIFDFFKKCSRVDYKSKSNIKLGRNHDFNTTGNYLTSLFFFWPNFYELFPIHFLSHPSPFFSSDRNSRTEQTWSNNSLIWRTGSTTSEISTH